MAKNSFKTSFTKATITKDGDKYIITEVTKDDSISYDLSDILDGLVDVEGISLSVNKDSDLKPIEE
jgi:hypothetical protein